MSKMNQPIKMTKAINGHKSATPIKGDTANYDITTNVGDTIGTITKTSDNSLVATVGGLNLKQTIKRAREAMVSLGVKFPILQAASVPAVSEVQRVTFNLLPDAGSYRLNHAGTNTALILSSDNAAALQTKLRAIPALSQVTVTGDNTAGMTITFVGVPGNVALLTSNTNTLTSSATPVVITVTEITPGS